MKFPLFILSSFISFNAFSQTIDSTSKFFLKSQMPECTYQGLDSSSWPELKIYVDCPEQMDSVCWIHAQAEHNNDQIKLTSRLALFCEHDEHRQ